MKTSPKELVKLMTKGGMKGKNGRGLKVIDGSWFMPASGIDAEKIYKNDRVPTAVYFDIDKVSEKDDMPHTWPSETTFNRECQQLNIQPDDDLIIYDQKGLFSAARVYYLFKYHGHEGQLTILEGGLPAYRKERTAEEDKDFEEKVIIENKKEEQQENIKKYKVDSSKLVPLKVMLEVLEEENVNKRPFKIVDARSEGRFNGREPEPRPIPSGHMPGAVSLPYTDILTQDGAALKPKEELEKYFSTKKLKKDEPIVASCGSGVTACVIMYALENAGYKQLALYDGSWSEYAVQPDVIIETL